MNGEGSPRPTVSVFTCVYNMADKIHRVFDSMLAQTYPHIEHIIVDDGSTDNLLPLVEAYIQKAPYPVVFLQKENGGKHTATNLAWDCATGEYLIQLDADDAYLPHTLEFLVNTWNSIPEAVKGEYWCVHGRCKDQIRGEMIGPPYPDGINALSWEESDRIVSTVGGEKIGMMKRSCLAGMRYPEPKGVKFVWESILWHPLNRRYRTWYTNEIVRIYYINEGGTLSSPSRTPQALANRAWDAKWRITEGRQYGYRPAKELLRYAVTYRLATPAYRHYQPYLQQLPFLFKLGAALLYLPAIPVALLLRRRYRSK